MVLCFTKYTTKIYNKATIHINELIVTLFSLFDIKCKILTLIRKTSGIVFLGHLGGVRFPYFPKVVLVNVCVWEWGTLNTF